MKYPPIKLDEVTPEQAAELTASCKEVDTHGGGRWGDKGPRYWQALIWCNKKGEVLAATGKTCLEAVVNAHNKVREIGYV